MREEPAPLVEDWLRPASPRHPRCDAGSCPVHLQGSAPTRRNTSATAGVGTTIYRAWAGDEYPTCGIGWV
jgi:hypothetical protein